MKEILRRSFAVVVVSCSLSTRAESPASAFHCETALALNRSIELSDYYLDSAKSIVDPVRRQAYENAVKPLREAARAVDEMADRYRSRHDGVAARCAASWLEGYARQGALLDAHETSQAVYVQGWISGSLAIAWLKVRDANIPQAQQTQITGWLATLASRNIGYYDSRPPTARDARNNLRYWAGLTAFAAGLAAGRQDLIDWGIGSYRLGVDQISPDGTLPLEMERKSLALQYHLFAAAPLVTIAELGELNETPLYGYRNGALGRLVERALLGIGDPSFFADRTGQVQKRGELRAEDVVWASPFLRRFPDPRLVGILQGFPRGTMLYIGGRPLR
jgi:poly(beta-D-mannuronate) lyase